MSIKLQINSKAALERLIGGDTELEMEIRNNIVQEFTNKRLKGLIDVELEKRVIDESLDKLFSDYKTAYGHGGVRLTKDQKIVIADLIEQTIKDLVKSEIEDFFIKSERIKKLLEDSIEYSIWNTVEKIVKVKLKESLTEALHVDVEKAIEAILK